MAPPLKIFSVCFVFLLWSCSAHTSPDIPERIKALDNLTVHSRDAKPASDIILTKETEYRDTEEVLLGPVILDMEVDNRGRVYLADNKANTIHVYNPDGSYLQSLGRAGKGPGEFQMLRALEVQNSRLYALDYLRQKIVVFDTGNLQHRRDISIALHETEEGDKPSWIDRMRKQRLFYRAGDFYVRRDSSYLIVFSDNGVATADNLPGRTYELSAFDPAEDDYIRHDILSFKWTGGVLVHEDNNSSLVMFNVPYKRTSQFDYSNGQLVYGWTGELLFKFYSRDGTYQHAFYYPYEKAELKLDDVYASYSVSVDERTKEAFRKDTLPQTWPAFHSVVKDDENRLWISVLGDDPKTYEWWVTDEQGKRLARFTWPRNRKLKQVKNGFAYTLERSKETGLPKAVKYRVGINVSSLTKGD